MRLTTLCYIEKDEKYLMLHRTKKKKDENHDKWIGVGGKFEAGESPDECVIREVKEETGIDVSNAGGGYVFTYQRINPEEKNNYFVDIYKFVLEFDEKDVKVQDEEVAGFEIATVEQIKAYAKQGIFLHYDSIRQVFED